MKLECVEEVPDSSVVDSEARISYNHPEDNREARETYIITHNGREPTHEELAQYISTGQEAKDFYKIRNSVLVG